MLQDKKQGVGIDTNTHYVMVPGWLKLPPGFVLGNPVGIGIDNNQHVCILHRAGRAWPLLGNMPGNFIKENTVLVADSRTGAVIKTWGNNCFIMPHGLSVDDENNIWITDVGLHQVFKFNNDGKLLMTLGEAKIPGNDSLHFNQPTDVAVAADGSFYISDGYKNSRVVKFSAQGKYLYEWGKAGNCDGEFIIPHGIDLDREGNVYVADRENNRIQVFDATGKFLKSYAGEDLGNICSVTIDKISGKIFATDDLSFLKMMHRGSDVLILDTAGEVQTRFGRSGDYDGPVCWYHDIAIDSGQNIYVGDVKGNRVQKFTRMKL